MALKECYRRWNQGKVYSTKKLWIILTNNLTLKTFNQKTMNDTNKLICFSKNGCARRRKSVWKSVHQRLVIQQLLKKFESFMSRTKGLATLLTLFLLINMIPLWALILRRGLKILKSLRPLRKQSQRDKNRWKRRKNRLMKTEMRNKYTTQKLKKWRLFMSLK